MKIGIGMSVISAQAVLFLTLAATGCLASKADLSSTKIVYTLYDEWEPYIWVMNYDGSQKKKLARGTSPCWSPDAQRIAFTAETEWNWDIYFMNADGSDISRLTTHPARDVYPSWSPDGSMIAFNSDRSGSSQIWRTNIVAGDGHEAWGYNLTQLTLDTPHRRSNNFHSWSPNGLWLAFEADRDRDDPEIYLANAVDGTNQRRLTFTRALDEVPSWSPDSKEILFSSDRHGEPKSGDYDIYIMDIDGSNTRRLTDLRGAASNPTMSPDGSKIAFDLGPPASSEIWIIDKDGSNPVRLGKGSDPAWSPFMKNRSKSSRRKSESSRKAAYHYHPGVLLGFQPDVDGRPRRERGPEENGPDQLHGH